MTNKLKQTNLATAIKRITLCASGVALMAVSGISQAAEVKIGGYVKTDVTYDTDQDLGSSLNATAVATGDGAPSDPSFRIHSLQSRFNISATEGEMHAFIELDFFTGDSGETVSNSRHSRLRHAYGKVGNLLIGQTWSTFMDANWVLYPSTVDFGGPAGATFIRQSQLRWSVNDNLDIALENPENSVEGESARDTVPDIVVRYARKGTISWQVAGLAQQFEVDGGTADGDTETNFAYMGGINVNFGSGSISAKANVNANRYTYYGWANPSAVVSGGNIELIDHVGGNVALNLDWGGKSNAKTTIAYGIVTFDDDFLGATQTEEITTIHANYRWSPYKKVNFGLEVSMADRELVNGDDGDNTRLQFGAQYSF